MEELALVVDAVADVVADVVVANNKTKSTNAKPLIHGPLFVDCVVCPNCVDRYKFRAIL